MPKSLDSARTALHALSKTFTGKILRLHAHVLMCPDV